MKNSCYIDCWREYVTHGCRGQRKISLRDTLHFLKTFLRQCKCLKQLKFAPTTVEMFSNTLFSYYFSFLGQLCHKRPFRGIVLFPHHLYFQYSAVFSVLRRYIFIKLPNKHPFFFLKHFHGRGFNFHHMKVKLYTVDLISQSNLFSSF